MSRREFSNPTKRDAAARANGHCEECGMRLRFGEFHYDHILPCALGGEATLENCQVLCHPCHKHKTSKQDVPQIAKMKRQRDAARGIRRNKQKIKGWQKFDGTPVRASRER
ncbi:hypothetical protein GCM10007276_11970 [Agaricicola taiwanensis]|uniref:HNH nuclease domain-containing protein n=1 Tax=Agaricicola taiwanensis TaxID=591372 RepID=A0A8J2VPB9_9RHOB|nr:HNH endonuclease signature motif containing protein [Agaricicola taiwanensis]GGE36102.1 hypothetical protein GCM10007276_11970 [Agaricicola taiwanensis]